MEERYQEQKIDDVHNSGEILHERPMTRRKSITPLDQQIDPLTGKPATKKDMMWHFKLGERGHFGKQVNPVKRVEDARVARREKLAGKLENSLRFPVSMDDEARARNKAIKVDSPFPPFHCARFFSQRCSHCDDRVRFPGHGRQVTGEGQKPRAARAGSDRPGPEA